MFTLNYLSAICSFTVKTFSVLQETKLLKSNLYKHGCHTNRVTKQFTTKTSNFEFRKNICKLQITGNVIYGVIQKSVNRVSVFVKINNQLIRNIVNITKVTE